MVGNRQTQFVLENRQSEYFCLTYFSKLNRDQIEKKLWHFEDNPVSTGGGKPSRKSRKSDTTFCWVLMCDPHDFTKVTKMFWHFLSFFFCEKLRRFRAHFFVLRSEIAKRVLFFEDLRNMCYQ